MGGSVGVVGSQARRSQVGPGPALKLLASAARDVLSSLNVLQRAPRDAS